MSTHLYFSVPYECFQCAQFSCTPVFFFIYDFSLIRSPILTGNVEGAINTMELEGVAVVTSVGA